MYERLICHCPIWQEETKYQGLTKFNHISITNISQWIKFQCGESSGTIASCQSSGSSISPSISFVSKSQTATTEILWAIHAVKHNYSADSCDKVAELNKKMYSNAPNLDVFDLSLLRREHDIRDRWMSPSTLGSRQGCQPMDSIYTSPELPQRDVLRQRPQSNLHRFVFCISFMFYLFLTVLFLQYFFHSFYCILQYFLKFQSSIFICS